MPEKQVLFSAESVREYICVSVQCSRKKNWKNYRTEIDVACYEYDFLIVNPINVQILLTCWSYALTLTVIFLFLNKKIDNNVKTAGQILMQLYTQLIP